MTWSRGGFFILLATMTVASITYFLGFGNVSFGKMYQELKLGQRRGRLERGNKYDVVSCAEDKKKLESMLQYAASVNNISSDQFYSVITNPFQTACNNIKMFGGIWLNRVYDGVKYVCMDDILEQDDSCLVYSFGIGAEISFEVLLNNMGCTIHAYDHTIPDELASNLNSPSKHIFAHHLGVGKVSEGKLMTLEDAFVSNGHSEANITYLKVDVEGAELDLLPSWLESDILKNVKQVGIEFHWVPKTQESLTAYYKILLAFHAKGFSLISFDANYGAGFMDGYMSCFEVLFRRIDMNARCDWN